MMIEELWELVEDLTRRAGDCREIAQQWEPDSVEYSRLLSKASAYDHAADLLADELRRLEA